MSNQITAVADARADDVGAASGLVSAAYQVGGALGLAFVTTLSQIGAAASAA